MNEAFFEYHFFQSYFPIRQQLSPKFVHMNFEGVYTINTNAESENP